MLRDVAYVIGDSDFYHRTRVQFDTMNRLSEHFINFQKFIPLDSTELPEKISTEVTKLKRSE